MIAEALRAVAGARTAGDVVEKAEALGAADEKKALQEE